MASNKRRSGINAKNDTGPKLWGGHEMMNKNPLNSE
jgi:hypothetical protein